MSTLSARLRELRGTKTQAEFAKEIGVSIGSYGHYETGRREPDIATLLQIVEKTGASADYLIGSREPTICMSSAPQNVEDKANWKIRAITAEKKLMAVNDAVTLILKGTQKLQEAMK